MRKTKIIATLGPASNSETTIRELIAAGVDVFRLNFSHGSHEGHAEAIRRVRQAERDASRSIALLQDLSGPKIRTGRLRDGKPIELETGDRLIIAVGDFVGDAGRVSTTYAELPKALRRGDVLLLDDGRIQLRVEDARRDEVVTVVEDGGSLGELKGINLPGVELPSGAPTEKDLKDLEFGVAAGVDWIALSFVQSANDLRRTREALRKAGAPDLPIMAKLERPQAISRIEEILNECDAVMVARGDLGLELPLEQVPRVQKEVTRRARAHGVPVVVATQVLESMRVEPRPTRAEVSDAANAVDDGVDGIMLAGETAIGAFPVEAVRTLDLVIRDAESIPTARLTEIEESRLLSEHSRAICEAAVTLAERGHATAIVAVTRGGKTARVLAALRPRAPIFGATDHEEIARRLVLAWGVSPVLTDLGTEVNAVADQIRSTLIERRAVAAGDVIVVVSVTLDLARGPSNFIKLQRV